MGAHDIWIYGPVKLVSRLTKPLVPGLVVSQPALRKLPGKKKLTPVRPTLKIASRDLPDLSFQEKTAVMTLPQASTISRNYARAGDRLRIVPGKILCGGKIAAREYYCAFHISRDDKFDSKDRRIYESGPHECGKGAGRGNDGSEPFVITIPGYVRTGNY